MTPEAANSADRHDRRRLRTVITTVLGVLTVIVMVVTVIAVWASVTILQPEPVAELVGDAIAEPEVQTALAAYLADQVATSVDSEARLRELLPDTLDRFAGPIAAGANAAVERALGRVLATPAVQETITTLVERAHDRAMRVLEGDGSVDGVNVSGEEVSINLLPLIGRGLTALQSSGLLDDVVVPELSADGEPDEQRAALSAALGPETCPTASASSSSTAATRWSRPRRPCRPRSGCSWWPNGPCGCSSLPVWCSSRRRSSWRRAVGGQRSCSPSEPLPQWC